MCSLYDQEKSNHVSHFYLTAHELVHSPPLYLNQELSSIHKAVRLAIELNGVEHLPSTQEIGSILGQEPAHFRQLMLLGKG